MSQAGLRIRNDYLKAVITYTQPPPCGGKPFLGVPLHRAPRTCRIVLTMSVRGRRSVDRAILLDFSMRSLRSLSRNDKGGVVDRFPLLSFRPERRNLGAQATDKRGKSNELRFAHELLPFAIHRAERSALCVPPLKYLSGNAQITFCIPSG